MKMKGNTMLVTGAGSGIGRELAQRFHDQGNTVIVAGRNMSSLQDTIAGRERMHVRRLDVTDPDEIQNFARELITAFPDLNVVVNNAGVMRYENLSVQRDLADAEATITTNLLGPIRLLDALINHLADQPDAAILNVTSGLGFVPLAAAPTYSASKSALHAYTVALRCQLADSVEVIELVPPAVQTELPPGQSTRDGYMPLNDFIEETMSLLRQEPTPMEILVERVNFLRFAERDNRFEDAVEALAGLVSIDSLR